MAVHFITGKLGGGKTLVSVGKIREYLLAGKKVATNLDIFLEHLIPRDNKNCVLYRIPDKPSIDDLIAIGRGTDSKHDEDFGLLVLDELGTWLNSRTYQKDKGRQDVIDWFLHARHLGWDVLLIVQDPELIDKQIRISIGEHIVFCRRTDRIPIPLVSFFVKLLTGKRLKLPRIHVGSVFYGAGRGAIKVDTWVYRGLELFPAYDTSQIFVTNENRTAQFIPPAFLDQRKFSKKCLRFYMRITRIYFKRFSAPVAFFLGLFLNFVFLFVFLGFSGNSSEADIPDKSLSVVNNVDLKNTKKQELNFLDSSQVVELVKIPFGEIYINNKPELQLFYDGEMFSLKTFPKDITWRNGKPYLSIIVSSSPDKKESSKTGSLLSSFVD